MWCDERVFALVAQEMELLAFVFGGTVIGLDDVQREATSVLHAGGAEDRAKRTGCTALLADDLANVGGGNFEPKYSGVLIEKDLDIYGVGVVDQGFGDLAYESADLGDRIGRVKCFCHYSTSKARTGVFIARAVFFCGRGPWRGMRLRRTATRHRKSILRQGPS
jgi:hypothetical protein